MRWIDRAALDEIDEPTQRVAVERRLVVRPDLDVHADDPPAVERLAQGRVVHQRPAVRHASLDDHVGCHAVNHLLQPDHIVGQLNDRPPEPAEGVGVLLVPPDLEPQPRQQLEPFLRVQRHARFAALGAAHDHAGVGVYREGHACTIPPCAFHQATVSQIPSSRRDRGVHPTSRDSRVTSAMTRGAGSCRFVSDCSRCRPSPVSAPTISPRRASAMPSPDPMLHRALNVGRQQRAERRAGVGDEQVVAHLRRIPQSKRRARRAGANHRRHQPLGRLARTVGPEQATLGEAEARLHRPSLEHLVLRMLAGRVERGRPARRGAL